MAYFEVVSLKESTSIIHRDEFTACDVIGVEKGKPYQTDVEFVQILKVREAQEDRWGISNGIFATRWYLHSTKHGVLSVCKTKGDLIRELIYYTGDYANKHGGCL